VTCQICHADIYFTTKLVFEFKDLSLKNGGWWSNLVTMFGFNNVKSMKIIHLFFFTRRKAIPTSVISMNFFLSMTSFYPPKAGVEGYCWTWSHSVTHTLGRTARRRDTLHPQETDSQATGGIQTRNYRKRDATVLRLRGHWARPLN
jgi:hypothetical protein